MFRIVSLAFLSLFLSSCLSSQLHLYTKDENKKLKEDKLSLIFANVDELTAVKLNEIPVKMGMTHGAGGYVLPGKQKISAQYSWTNYHGMVAGVFLTSNSNKSGRKTICFMTEAGKEYYVKATPPNISNWKIYVRSDRKNVATISCD